jgi:hypothetical protein
MTSLRKDAVRQARVFRIHLAGRLPAARRTLPRIISKLGSALLRSHGLDEFPANPFEATGASSNNDAEVNSEEVPSSNQDL